MAKFISAWCLVMMFPALAIFFFGVHLSNEKIEDYGDGSYWMWSGVIMSAILCIVQIFIYLPQWLAKNWNEGD